ncbi:penicillin acylase family protein, partial [candidate division KSB1 bacterium]|nr:penicillin acylase family protein [candidate division KSB1 bacterium]
MRLLKFAASAACMVLLIFLLNNRIGLLPPLGKFLDPFHGFWQNAETANTPVEKQLTLPDLDAPITILYDDRSVPHIFAENDHDLYFAQGYLTARDRLWQMGFQTRAAAGRLSEVLGRRTLAYDRFQRRIGMTYGARNALKAMAADSVVRRIIHAYTAGVNAYIQTLTPETYPVEYKILDYAPEEWTPLKCALLLKYMAWMLTGRSTDLKITNTLARFGAAVVHDLFPEYPENMDAVIPAGTPWRFDPVKVEKPDSGFLPRAVRAGLQFEPHSGNGSNNWVVSGKKTISGFPLLANDPHLGLSLPSIWYEVQLINPSVNVYGVSLPGVPNVIVGFNEKIAWGVTNAGADVMDWYEIKFQDAG